MFDGSQEAAARAGYLCSFMAICALHAVNLLQ